MKQALGLLAITRMCRCLFGEEQRETKRKKRAMNVLKRIALALSVPCVMVTTSEAQECGEPNSCHPDSFLEFGSWVFTSDPKMIARCDGYQVLVVYANGTDMLFLDETVRPRAGVKDAAEQGLSFGEFNSYHASNDIEAISCQVLETGKLQIAGTASSDDDDSTFKFWIFVDTAKRSYTYEDTRSR